MRNHRPIRKIRLISSILVSTGLLLGCAHSDDGPSPPKSPQDELSTFQLEPDLDITLVASEPMVQDPVVMTFDEAGRLWVVEMRSFMPDIEGKGETDKIGRVSVLEDKNGDGVMDVSTVYLDSLTMPRAIAIVKGGVLLVEDQALWMTTDTNNDLKADTKVLIDKDYAGSAMPEHAGNGLLRALDNWYYNAKSTFRYRFIDGVLTRDSTEFRGQWGISQDNTGRLYYNYNWSQLHGDLVPPNKIKRNRNHLPTTGIDFGLTADRRVYPARTNPAVNRGYIPGTLDDKGKLFEFTAACSPFYHRGQRLGETYQDNVFVCEPAGNLIKRNVVRHEGVYVGSKDPHPGREFLASTDERFRPVYITGGPDGALYVADMYRGLIEHGAYLTPYLKEQTLLRKLFAPVHLGRIWKITKKGTPVKGTSNLKGASTKQLIEMLANPDPWHRDIAQRLLVESDDANAGPLLKTVLNSTENQLQRLHALWCLEGLNQLDPALLVQALRTGDEQIKIHAIRLLEHFISSNNVATSSLNNEVKALLGTSQPIDLQIALTAGLLNFKDRSPILEQVITRYDTSALMRDAVMSSLSNEEFNFMKTLKTNPSWRSSSPAREVFFEMLSHAILRRRAPEEVGALITRLSPDLATWEWQDKTVFTALSIMGQSNAPVIALRAAPKFLTGNFPPQDTSRVSAVLSLLAWPGHAPVRSGQASRSHLNEADQKRFLSGRQHYLTTCSGCHGSDGNGLNRFAPPLAGSDWVTGNEKRLALVILHGLEGPVEVLDKKYDAPEILPVMPSHSTMDDDAITSVMTYIRNEWGNHAGAVNPRTVPKTRHTTQGRVLPWSVQELNSFIDKNPQVLDLK